METVSFIALMVAVGIAVMYLQYVTEPVSKISFSDLLQRVRQLRLVVGQIEMQRMVVLLQNYADKPSVIARNDIMDILLGWKLRHVDSDTTCVFIGNLVNDIEQWSLTFLSAKITDYDAPRESNVNENGTFV